MTRTYYTVSFPKAVTDAKTVWPKVGVAFPRDNGRIDVMLDSIPIHWDGKLMLFPAEMEDKKSPATAAGDTYELPNGEVVVAKKHLRNPDHASASFSFCSRFTPSKRLTDDLAEVTCASCKKVYERRGGSPLAQLPTEPYVPPPPRPVTTGAIHAPHQDNLTRTACNQSRTKARRVSTDAAEVNCKNCLHKPWAKRPVLKDSPIESGEGK